MFDKVPDGDISSALGLIPHDERRASIGVPRSGQFVQDGIYIHGVIWEQLHPDPPGAIL